MYPEKRNLTKTPNQGGSCERDTFTIHTHLWAMMMKVKKRNRVGAGEDGKSKTVKKTQRIYVCGPPSSMGWSNFGKEIRGVYECYQTL